MKGETVKIVLNRYGIKQTALAESMNVVFQNLNSILNGPDLKTSNLEKISEATGIPIAEFYGEHFGKPSTTTQINSNNTDTTISENTAIIAQALTEIAEQRKATQQAIAEISEQRKCTQQALALAAQKK